MAAALLDHQQAWRARVISAGSQSGYRPNSEIIQTSPKIGMCRIRAEAYHLLACGLLSSRHSG
jgi:hypothetical protein